VECSLHTISGIVKAVDVEAGGRIGKTKLSATESSSSSSESDGKLYQASSLSSVDSVYTDSSESEESGGEESSDWLSDKSGKTNRPLKIAMNTNLRI
jgi:hypothetical protein